MSIQPVSILRQAVKQTFSMNSTFGAIDMVQDVPLTITATLYRIRSNHPLHTFAPIHDSWKLCIKDTFVLRYLCNKFNIMAYTVHLESFCMEKQRHNQSGNQTARQPTNFNRSPLANSKIWRKLSVLFDNHFLVFLDAFYWHLTDFACLQPFSRSLKGDCSITRFGIELIWRSQTQGLSISYRLELAPNAFPPFRYGDDDQKINYAMEDIASLNGTNWMGSGGVTAREPMKTCGLSPSS